MSDHEHTLDAFSYMVAANVGGRSCPSTILQSYTQSLSVDPAKQWPEDVLIVRDGPIEGTFVEIGARVAGKANFIELTKEQAQELVRDLLVRLHK